MEIELIILGVGHNFCKKNKYPDMQFDANRSNEVEEGVWNFKRWVKWTTEPV